MEFPMRINKYLAKQNIASRREADVLIADGKVLVNGQKAEVGQSINQTDTVEVTGKTKNKTYLAYYKGRGIITHSPSEQETDIASRLASDYGLSGISPIGRLDKDSEGLMILSNDGRITGPLLDPQNDIEKEYEVTVDKKITGRFLKDLELGVEIEGYRTKPARAVRHPKNDHRLTLTITEGKKHQIRRMCAALGYQVQSLKRTRIAHINIGKLKPNQYRKLDGKEISTLLKTLDIK
jgi:23S rRNA pseudouridine2604 synthase